MKVKYIGVLPKGKVHLGYKEYAFDKDEIIDVSAEDFKKFPDGEFLMVDEGGSIAVSNIPKSDREALIELKDVEDEIADALLERFGSLENVKSASLEELDKVPGIGVKRAKSIKEQLGE